jgi:UDP-N-acetylmuramyl pentapeptide phosphotransferase/UDP-N-acetylglucosamine-1-phosphate transferase
MGDVGSTFLGFVLAGWAVTGASRIPSVPALAAAAALSPFLFDAGVTLLRRLARGERVSQAHRSHMYQRLVACGWTHARTTALYGVLAAVAGILAIATWCLAPVRVAPLTFVGAVLTPAAIPFLLRRAAMSRSGEYGSDQYI